MTTIFRNYPTSLHTSVSTFTDATFTTLEQNQGPYIFSWTIGQSDFYHGNPTTISVANNGTYTLSVSAYDTYNGVSKSMDTEITVIDMTFVVSISSPSPMSIVPLGSQVVYSASVSSNNGSASATYNWSFDDSTVGAGSSVSKSWPSTGMHMATVTATETINGLTDTDTIGVLVGSVGWNTTGSRSPIDPTYSALAQLDDNRFMLIGGGSVSPSSKQCWIFNLSSQTWTRTGDLNYGRTRYGWPGTSNSGRSVMPVLANGMVFVYGNRLGNEPSAKAEVWDPATGIWSIVADAPYAISSRYGICCLSNGDIFVMGGGYSSTLYHVWQTFRLSTNTWSSGNLTLGGSYDGACSYSICLHDGSVLSGHISSNRWSRRMPNGTYVLISSPSGKYPYESYSIPCVDSYNQDKIWVMGYAAGSRFKEFGYIDITTNQFIYMGESPSPIDGCVARPSGDKIACISTTTFNGARVYNTSSLTWTDYQLAESSAGVGPICSLANIPVQVCSKVSTSIERLPEILIL